MIDPDFKVLTQGVRFQCQGSGKCCSSRGEYGYVYLTKDDRKRMAAELGLTPSVFTRKYCTQTDGFYHLKADHEMSDCLFLEDKKCRVYHGRPTQCRTWPFWPELMNAKTWNKEVVQFCPGVGKGRSYGPDEVRDLVNAQIRAERTP